MRRLLLALTLVTIVLAAGCSYQPGRQLSRDVDIHVERAYVLPDPCDADAAYDACHVIEIEVVGLTERTVSVGADRWEATKNRHYADPNEAVWVRPVLVDGPRELGPNQTAEFSLRFDADRDARFDVLRFHDEGAGKNQTVFVPQYRSPPGPGADNGSYALGLAVNVGGPGST